LSSRQPVLTDRSSHGPDFADQTLGRGLQVAGRYKVSKLLALAPSTLRIAHSQDDDASAQPARSR
jgi:hypothetical protein